MRLKLDENLGRRAIELFREAGHEVVTVLDQGLGASPDDALLEVCGSEGRALVTLDLDFSNVLRFPPARFAGIAVLRVPTQWTWTFSTRTSGSCSVDCGKES